MPRLSTALGYLFLALTVLSVWISTCSNFALYYLSHTGNMEQAEAAINLIQKYGLAPMGWFLVCLILYFGARACYSLFKKWLDKWVASDEKKSALLERLTSVSETQQIQLAYQEKRIEKLEDNQETVWETLVSLSRGKTEDPIVTYPRKPKKS